MSLDFDLAVRCEDAGDGVERWHYLAEWNYTHNVSKMWREAGCYEALYQSHGKLAKHIVDDVELAVKEMAANPDKYRAMNPQNGWGNYDGALEMLQEICNALQRYPLAIVFISA